jgi:ABC-2 type transport system ATP-binding protein
MRTETPSSQKTTVPERPTPPGHSPEPDARNGVDTVIWADRLAKKFNEEWVVKDVSFDIPRGTIFGFIGPSGSGKTTTLRMLTGIYAPTEGEAKIMGYSPHRFNRIVRGRIGYMPQLFVLYPDLTVWENLNFAASIYGMSFFRGARLKEVLEFVELQEHTHKKVRDISGGMQRRLSLASTLVHDPEVILLDEPTAGVDPVLRRKFWDHFRELQQHGRTIFVTTQYVAEAAYCDMIGVISNGRLLTVNTPTGLRSEVYGGEMIDLRTIEPVPFQELAELREIPLIVDRKVARVGDRGLRFLVRDAGTAIPELTSWFQNQGLSVESIEEYVPPFDDVFVELVTEENHVD